MDNTLLYDISYGMYIISANNNGKLAGCIVNTVAQITSENPIFAVSLNKDNYTYTVLKETGRFSISILSEQTKPEVIGTFGYQCSKDTDKFSTCKYELKDGLPVIQEACCGTMICELVSMTDMDTHVVVFGKIIDLIRSENLTPMTYSYYHNVVKGKAPKNAPTYQEESAVPASVSYVCSICGYVHEGDINDEPDDYVCPICEVSKDNFVLQD